jgi:predicted negative regulator of RcsB-dependent stress response
VAIPTLGYLVVGERLDAPLNRVKEWMERNHSALVAAILLVIGAALVYKGIHAL